MSGYVDRRTPFFLSYARATEGPPGETASHNPDLLVEQFFRDLKENVAELIRLQLGVEAGFMDRTIMRGGVRWTDELLRALGSCQILVALLSARYVQSEWCGMEWYAFTQRNVQRKRNASPNQGCIIPVIWAPIQNVELPALVKMEQQFSPSSYPDPTVPNQYREDGLFGLLRTRQETPYQIVVWRLAQHISSVYHSQRVAPRTYRKKEELRNIFLDDHHV